MIGSKQLGIQSDWISYSPDVYLLPYNVGYGNNVFHCVFFSLLHYIVLPDHVLPFQYNKNQISKTY